MANKHYSVEDELEVTIKVKIKNIEISNNRPLSEVQKTLNIDEFKKEISNHLKNKISNNTYYQQEVTNGVDWWSFEVE